MASATIRRGRYVSALDVEVIPAWKAFVAEVLPAGTVSRAAQAGNGASSFEDGAYYAVGSEARKLRRMAEETAYPSDETIWDGAEAVRALSNVDPTHGREWCAGPLALFAGSRFAAFAAVLIGAPESMVKNDRKQALLHNVVAACAPTVAMRDFDPIRGNLVAAGATDLDIVRAEQKFRRRQRPAMSAARRVWILEEDAAKGIDEEAAFDLGWRKRESSAHNIAVVTAALAQGKPEIGLTMQREIVLRALRAEIPPAQR